MARSVLPMRVRLGVLVAALFVGGVSDVGGAPQRRLAKALKPSPKRTANTPSVGHQKDPRVLARLVRTLRSNTNPEVRATAATSLGRLGAKEALPALQSATGDKTLAVRRQATLAIAALRSNTRLIVRKEPQTNEATMFLAVKSVRDETRGTQTGATRAKKLLLRQLAQTPSITLRQEDSGHMQKQRYVDLSITKLSRRVKGSNVEVECQIRVAVSDERGRMISVLTGGATVQTPRHLYREDSLGDLRSEAIENAVSQVRGDLVAHLETSG